MLAQSCPPQHELSDFLLGRIDEESADRVIAHVRECANCQETLLTCRGDQDTFIECFRQQLGEGDFDSEPQLRQTMRKLRHPASAET